VYPALSDAILTGRSSLPGPQVVRLLERAEALAAQHRFFHWELEFPEVFFEKDGTRRPSPGFDAIIGNPPWDMMRADAGSPERRAGARGSLGATVRFTRDSGVYASQSAGHANRYQLFVERSVALTRHGGRVGLVLPWGLYSDHGSRSLRRLLLTECSIDTIVGFDNRRGLFPIHRSVRFVMTTGTRGGPTVRIGCRLGEQDPSVLDNSDDEPAGPSWFPVHVTPALLERLSGDDHALPHLRSPVDLTIAERAAALFAPLGDPAGWAVRFGRELNASDDREHLVESDDGVPVVEGKAIAPFRVLLDAPRYRIRPHTARRLLGDRFGRPRLAYRDVASASNRLTLIAALLPARAVSTHTVFCLRTHLPLRSQLFLCGMFNSLVLNYLVRLRVSTHVTTAIVERLPVPSREAAGARFGEIAALARILTTRDEAAARARLNACAARLYQLERDELEHVLDTFPLVPIDERRDVLRAFERYR
jgi:Eco57I restriction-modification methylase